MRYKEILTRTSYDTLKESGMFWEFYPELSGNWVKDFYTISDYLETIGEVRVTIMDELGYQKVFLKKDVTDGLLHMFSECYIKVSDPIIEQNQYGSNKLAVLGQMLTDVNRYYPTEGLDEIFFKLKKHKKWVNIFGRS